MLVSLLLVSFHTKPFRYGAMDNRLKTLLEADSWFFLFFFFFIFSYPGLFYHPHFR